MRERDRTAIGAVLTLVRRFGSQEVVDRRGTLALVGMHRSTRTTMTASSAGAAARRHRSGHTRVLPRCPNRHSGSVPLCCSLRRAQDLELPDPLQRLDLFHERALLVEREVGQRVAA